MRGVERRTGETSIEAGTVYALNSSRCTRRGFVEGVGVAGTVGGLGGFSEVAPASSAAEVASASPLSQHWSTALSGTVQDYLIAPDLVYVVTRDGMVRTLGLETGKETNRLDLGASIRPYGLAKDGQYLAIGTGEHLLLNNSEWT